MKPAAIRRRRSFPAPVMDATTASSLQGGRLEQTCPECGRWEAAHAFCSWCERPMGVAQWYRNGLPEEREARRPDSAPANPPEEYRRAASWPAKWGPCPYAQEPASPRRTRGIGTSQAFDAPVAQIRFSL